jgi:hypothetical protein
VLHADETGARVSGARHWFHVACTDLVTLLDCHEQRGVDAFEAIGVLPFFSGVLVTDGWQPYWSIEGFEHALCLSHLLRDLASVAESKTYKPWADEMADLMVEVKCAVEKAMEKGHCGLTCHTLQQFRTRYTKILKHGFAAVPPKHYPNTANREAFNLLCRLESQREEATRYWSEPSVSPTNNQAERDLRMVKLQQKISGTFRTVEGAKAFCAIRSYTHTGQKHGLRHLDLLVLPSEASRGCRQRPHPLRRRTAARSKMSEMSGKHKRRIEAHRPTAVVAKVGGSSLPPRTPRRLTTAEVVDAIDRGDLDEPIEDIATAVNARIRVLNEQYDLAVASRLRVGSHVHLNHNLEPQYPHGQGCTVIARDADKWVLRLANPVGEFADKDLRVSGTQIAMPRVLNSYLF